MLNNAAILHILFWPGVILVVILALVGVASILLNKTEGGESEAEKKKPKYDYVAKKFFMTRAEHEFYDVLGQAVGHEYRIFAQVHISELVDEKVKNGQKWKAARAHIDRKSVDFLLCDKDYISPKLAIELDDKSHERPDRVERDTEVERILALAGLPLLRVHNSGSFDPITIAELVHKSLKA